MREFVSDVMKKQAQQERMFIDYDKLAKEIKQLEIDRLKIIDEQNKEIVALTKIREEIISLEKEAKLKKENASADAKKIIANAESKLGDAVKKESEVEGLRIGLDTKKKEYENLIKTNEGKSKNLDNLTAEYETKLKKINQVILMVQDVLK